jgi:DNA-binding HxlR family transcriptional regulator
VFVPGNQIGQGSEGLRMLHELEVDVGQEELRVSALQHDHPDAPVIADGCGKPAEVSDERRVEEVDRGMVDRHMSNTGIERNVQCVVVVIHTRDSFLALGQSWVGKSNLAGLGRDTPPSYDVAMAGVAKSWEGTGLCSLARTLEVVGERWTFLILREATAGTTRFSAFRSALGISSDILTARLTTLVDAGIMRRERYQEAGRRPREEYQLTRAGRDLTPVLASLQQWGDEHVPSPVPTITYEDRDGQPLRVSFIAPAGHQVEPGEVHARRP